MRTSIVIAAALLVTVSGTASSAQDAVSGRVIIVAADPSDFVTQLDKNGPCGSPYFHIQRASENFKEVVAVALTAFSTDSMFTAFIASCAGDRNIISHGYIGR